jgi:hypothetical protein
MKLTPELIAKLIFASSELRYFEKELVMEPSNELQDIVIRCQFRLDSILAEMGFTDFVALDSLKQIVELEYKTELKQAI